MLEEIKKYYLTSLTNNALLETPSLGFFPDSKSIFIEQLKAQSTIAINHLNQQLAEGLEVLLSEIKQLPPREKDVFERFLEEISGRALTLPRDIRSCSSATWTQSEERCNCFYQVGLHLLKESRWADASSLFSLLISFWPNEPFIWIGLGIANQKLNHLEEALVAYTQGWLLDQTRLMSLLHVIECYYLLNDIKNAQDTLQAVGCFFNSSELLGEERAVYSDLCKKMNAI